jgi:hypothetical protein
MSRNQYSAASASLLSPRRLALGVLKPFLRIDNQPPTPFSLLDDLPVHLLIKAWFVLKELQDSGKIKIVPYHCRYAK